LSQAIGRRQTPGRALGAQPVGVATVALGNINVEVRGLGGVTPLATVTVKTQINGQLMDVAFIEGQTVKKGDILAQIDPRPYQLARTQYEGNCSMIRGCLTRREPI
jgi:multidrug efflux system membrane fusion protein